MPFLQPFRLLVKNSPRHQSKIDPIFYKPLDVFPSSMPYIHIILSWPSKQQVTSVSINYFTINFISILAYGKKKNFTSFNYCYVWYLFNRTYNVRLRMFLNLQTQFNSYFLTNNILSTIVINYKVKNILVLSCIQYKKAYVALSHY